MQLPLFILCGTCGKWQDEYYIFGDSYIPPHCRTCYNSRNKARKRVSHKKIDANRAWGLLRPYYYFDGYRTTTLNGKQMDRRDIVWFGMLHAPKRVQAVKIDRLIINYNLPLRLEEFEG